MAARDSHEGPTDFREYFRKGLGSFLNRVDEMENQHVNDERELHWLLAEELQATSGCAFKLRWEFPVRGLKRNEGRLVEGVSKTPAKIDLVVTPRSSERPMIGIEFYFATGQYPGGGVRQVGRDEGKGPFRTHLDNDIARLTSQKLGLDERYLLYFVFGTGKPGYNKGINAFNITIEDYGRQMKERLAGKPQIRALLVSRYEERVGRCETRYYELPDPSVGWFVCPSSWRPYE
ncbi:MAG: hypothetical protein QXT68_07380 [Halobacteria archaeon]